MVKIGFASVINKLPWQLWDCQSFFFTIYFIYLPQEKKIQQGTLQIHVYCQSWCVENNIACNIKPNIVHMYKNVVLNKNLYTHLSVQKCDTVDHNS